MRKGKGIRSRCHKRLRGVWYLQEGQDHGEKSGESQREVGARDRPGNKTFSLSAPKIARIYSSSKIVTFERGGEYIPISILFHCTIRNIWCMHQYLYHIVTNADDEFLKAAAYVRMSARLNIKGNQYKILSKILIQKKTKLGHRRACG